LPYIELVVTVIKRMKMTVNYLCNGLFYLFDRIDVRI
jgi:hypothetical protein